MGKCSSENCENECFEEEKECVLHGEDSLLIKYLEKNINAQNELVLKGLNFSDTFGYHIIFNKSKKIEFWNCTFNSIDKEINFENMKKIHFYNCEFNKKWNHLNINEIFYSDCNFNGEIFFTIDLNNGINKIHIIVMHSCNIYQKFVLDYSAVNVEQCEIPILDLTNSVFHKKVEIKRCKLINSTFINTRFKSLCDFYKTNFYSNYFIKTTFEDIGVFTESIFHKKVNFKYTTFEKLVLFRKTVFEKDINLIDSIIKEEANFLEVTSKEGKVENINVANRETARIIKNSFEKENNIIEANKFYALEMKEMEKELDVFKNPLEWIVFKMHSISSNHSQSWGKPLIWIFIVSLLFSFVTFIYNLSNITSINIYPIIGSIFLMSIYNLTFYDSKIYKHFGQYILIVFLFVNYVWLTKDFSLSCIFNNINPFSIMTSWDEISFFKLIFKVIIAYLIYQFIVSVRQNTRRK